MMKQVAPWAPLINASNRFLVSARVKNFIYNQANTYVALNALLSSRGAPSTKASSNGAVGPVRRPLQPTRIAAPAARRRWEIEKREMWRFLARRLLWAAFTFFVVTFLTYVIFFVVPADPAKPRPGSSRRPSRSERVSKYLNLDEPIWKQYILWLKQLVFEGPSAVVRQPAGRHRHHQEAAPVTISLVFGGAILWLLVSIPIGVLSALKPRSLLDRGSMAFVLVGISAHPVWIGLIFAYIFGYKLGWTPITGYCDFFNPSPGSTCGGPAQWAYHMILPWSTFALLFAALYVRLIRANVMETMNEDYVRTARAKGAPPNQVMRSHILRNSMLPVVTILGMDIGVALGGAIFTESIFSLNGLGRSLILAYERSDLPVIVGIVVFSTIMVIIFTLIVDVLYAVVDPRIRLS